MSQVKNIADMFQIGDELPLKVVEFDKDSKKIVLSVVEYLKGKEQKLIDDYAAKHKLPAMTIKDVASVTTKAPETQASESVGTQPPTSDFLM
jgi:small subunit ribosomal protein S1